MTGDAGVTEPLQLSARDLAAAVRARAPEVERIGAGDPSRFS